MRPNNKPKTTRPATTRGGILLAFRNGALLATVAAAPILIGFLWNAVWGLRQNVTTGMYAVLFAAWLAASGVVAALTWNVRQTHGANAVKWFYPCARCESRVALISYRCMHCRAPFTPPPEASAFRNALLSGVGVFYALFGIGVFVLGRIP